MTQTSSTPENSVPELRQRFEQELLQATDPGAVLERYRALHPKLTESLRELAEAIEMLQATPFQHAPETGAVRSEAASPTRFGPYRVVRSIGRGGMGEVYEAVEEPLGRRVAVKTIRRSQTTGATLLLRFDRERRTLARLHHTNIVPIYATGSEEDLLYFAMPYIAGASLGQVIKTACSYASSASRRSSSTFEELLRECASRSQSVSEALAPPRASESRAVTRGVMEPTAAGSPEGPTSSTSAQGPGSHLLSKAYIRTAVQVIAAVAEGVHHAHEAGVVHRDLKPSNIMVETGGHAWVLDFGLATLRATSGGGVAAPAAFAIAPPTTENDATLTVGPIGTLPYMAPEQHRDGKQANICSDVWGLGVTLYELLTLQRAFATGEAVLNTDPIPPGQLNPGLDRDLEAVVLKALRKDPAHRYPTAQALAADLRHWLGSEPVTARKAHTLRRLGLWTKRNKGWAAAVLIAGLSVVFLGIGGLVLGERDAARGQAEARAARLDEARAQAEARNLEIQRDAALEQERIRKSEVRVQELQRIRILPHDDGWRKRIEGRIIEAKELGGDRGSLRTQAIASLRDFDAFERKELPYAASNLAFDPRGRRLYSCWFQDGVIRVWDQETEQTQTLALKGEGPFAFRPDGTPWQLAHVDKDDRTLVLHDLARGTVLRRFTSPRQDRAFLAAITITPSGSHAAALWQASKPEVGVDPPENGPPALFVVWEAATGAVVRRIDHAAPAIELSLAPDGRMLAVGDVHGNVAVWTLPDGTPYATLSAGDNRIQCLAFGREPRVSYRQRPDTTAWQLAVGDDGGILTLFDLQHKRIRNIARGPGGDIKALAFRPDGAVLVSAGRGAARLWDVATGRMLLSVRAGNTLPSVVFSEDGRRLAIGRWGVFGDTHAVKVYDLREGQGMQTLLGLQAVARAGFSGDGRWIAALSGDWQVGIWDRANGQLRHILAVPPGYFPDNAWFAFDPMARRFAFSGGEHATLWDLQTGRLIQTWKLPPGLQDKLAFHGPEQLFLFRSETRDRVPPFSANHPKDHPRVYRLYNLLGPSPQRPLKEIGDHDGGCFGIAMPADGRFVVSDGMGVKDGHRVRSFNAYDGQTGETLWSMSAPPTQVDSPLITLDPTGAILVLDHREKSSSTWLKLPRRVWMRDLPIRPPCLAPGGNRWFACGGDRATDKSEWHYYPDGHNGPEIAFAEQGDVGGVFAFGPNGRHVAWGGGNPAVVVCDLVELQRAMAEFGLGW